MWQRFLEAPGAYPNLPDLLRRARPTGQLALFEQPCPYWPQDTEAAEGKLRAALLGLANEPPEQVRTMVNELEGQHRERRQWVWSKLGMSPLAEALAALARLAAATESTPGGRIWPPSVLRTRIRVGRLMLPPWMCWRQ